MRARWLPWVLSVSLVVLFGVVASARIVHESTTELTAAREALQVDQPMRAVEHYRRAMRWKLPLSPYPRRAAQSLEALAQQLEGQGRVEEAMLAWRSLAGSAAATRSIFAPTDPMIEKASRALLRLSQTRGPGEPVTASVVRREAKPMRAPAPHPWWSTCLLLGFATWVGGLVATVSRGFDRLGHLIWSQAKLPLSASILGFTAFVTGAWLA